MNHRVPDEEIAMTFSSLFPWFGRSRPIRSRRPGRSHRSLRPSLEDLENRFLLDTKTFAGLEFQTVNAGDTFSVSGNQISTTSAVEVGPASTNGSTFAALMRLDNGVSYDNSDTTGRFTTDGPVKALTGNMMTTLFSGDSHTFSAPSLLGSGDNHQNDTSGSSLHVAGLTFSLADISFANNALKLQGSLAISKLGGLTLAVNAPDYVSIDSSGVHLTGLDVTTTQATLFTLGGATLTLQSLHAKYSSSANEFDMSATASLKIASTTATVQLGNTAKSGTITPGIKIVDGSLTGFQGTISSDIDFSHSFKIENPSLSVDYQQADAATNKPEEITATGSADLVLPDANNATFSVKLGDSDSSDSSQGIVYQDGEGLTNFDLSITSTSSFTTHGLTFTPESLHVTYQETTDSSQQTHQTVTVTGKATFSVGPLQSVEIALGDAKTNGLVIKDGTLQTLDASVSAKEIDFGSAIKLDNLVLGINYDQSGDEYKITGSGDLEITSAGSTSTISVGLGDKTDPGIVISDNATTHHASVTHFDLSASDTEGFTFHGLSFTNLSLDVVYDLDDSGNTTFKLSGGADLSFTVGSLSQNIGIELGDTKTKTDGLVITNGTLESLDASVTADFNFKALEIKVDNLSVVYDKSNDDFTLDGTVSVSTKDSDMVDVSATFGDGGSNHGIVIQNGELQSLYISVGGGFNFASISILPKDLTIQYDTTNDDLKLSGGLSLPLSSAIQADAEIVKGALVINTDTGALSFDATDGLELKASVTIGPFSVKDLDIKFSEGTGGINVSASGTLDFPGGFDVSASFSVVNGQLAEIGLSYSDDTGIAVGDTGLFITSMSGEIDNINDPTNLTITASVTATYGKTITIAGTDYALLKVKVSIDKLDKDELDMSGNVWLLDTSTGNSTDADNGILGTGTATLDLNWSTGVYTASVDVSLLNDTFDFDGSIYFNSSGDLTVSATATINVPEVLRTLVGQDQLLSASFYLQVQPGDATNTFAAAWTTIDGYTVGFEMNLNGAVTLLDGPPAENQTVPGGGFFDHGFVVPASNVDHDTFYFTTNASNSDFIRFMAAHPLVSIQTITSTGPHLVGQMYLDGGAYPQSSVTPSVPDWMTIELVSKTSTSQKWAIIVNPSKMPSSEASSTTYLVIIHPTDAQYAVPTAITTSFDSAVDYDSPTAMIDTAGPNDAGHLTGSIMAHSYDPNAKTTVSLYYDHVGAGFNGVAIQQWNFSDVTSDGDAASRYIAFDADNVGSLIPKPFRNIPFYLYVTIDDGEHPIQEQYYTQGSSAPNAIMPADPTPAVTTPVAVTPQGLAVAVGTQISLRTAFAFGPPSSTFVKVTDHYQVPVTLTLSVDTGAAVGSYVTQSSPFGTYYQFTPVDLTQSYTFSSAQAAQNWLNRLIVLGTSQYRGLSILTITAQTQLSGQTFAGTSTLPMAAPNTHLIVTTNGTTDPQEGDTITANVRLQNPGGPEGQDGTDTQAQVDIPAGLTLLSSQPNAGVFDPESGVWTIGAAPIGTDMDLLLTLKVNSGTAGQGLGLSAVGTATPAPVYLDYSSSILVIRPHKPIVVNTLEDPSTPKPGQMTFRQAVIQSNSDPGRDIIDFAVHGAISLQRVLPALTDAVTIAGPGADQLGIRVPAGNRMFDVKPNVRAVISGLELSDGHAGPSTIDHPGRGGAILNQGTLTLDSDWFDQNQAEQGGAIYNLGRLEVENSTFSNNQAHAAVTVATVTQYSGFGGAIDDAGSLILTNSTLTANQADFGGGVYTSSSAHFASDTIVGNTATAPSAIGGGIVFARDGSLSDTIVAKNLANNQSSDLDGHVSGDHNLIGIDTGFTGISVGHAGNQIGTTSQPLDPQLAPLGYHGGHTKTLPPLSGSPAIDAAGDVPAQADQRGLARVVNGHMDIGAAEYQYDLAVTITAANTVALGDDLTFTVTVSNNGPDTTAVNLTDTLPANGRVFSWAPATGTTGWSTGTGSGIASARGTLASGTSATFLLKVHTTAGPGISDTASVSPATWDTNAGNNSSTLSVPVTTLSNLAVTIAGPGAVLRGDLLTYTVTVTNSSPNATAVTVTDVLPANAPLLQWQPADGVSGWTTSLGNGTASASGNLAAGASASFLLEVTASSGPSATNGASVGPTGTTTIDSTAKLTVPVASQYDLAVGISAPSAAFEGDVLTYTVTVTNQGPDAVPVELTDTLPGNAPLLQWGPAGGTNGWTTSLGDGTVTADGNLAAGASASFLLGVMASAGPNTTDSASVGPITGDTSSSNNSTALTVPVVYATTTALTSDAADGVTYGQSITITATVSSDGGTPTGSIQFQVDGVDFGNPVPLTNGSASVTTSSLAAGLHDITAGYTSDNTAFASSGVDPLSESVLPAPLTISADDETMTYGGAVPTLTASYAGFVNGDTPAGLTTLPTLTTTASSRSSEGDYLIGVDGAADPNYTIRYVTGTLTVAQATTHIQTADELYVGAAYQSLLQRPVDTGGLAYWSGQLGQGASREVISAELTHSAEYYQTNVIKPAYEKFLNRAADAAGLAFWTTQLQNGMTDEQMQAGFIASDEFYRIANQGSTPVPVTPAHDRAWVDALYQVLLGRGPDQAGEDYWTNQLEGSETRLQVANGFTGSTEGLSVRIEQTYQRYLTRPADSGGLAYWLSQYHAGATNEDIVTGFIGSDEFFAQATM
jgi:uncharacterized repeat protein (TIGR01451 family)